MLGHSYGGCVALQYALRHPRHVSHLLLVGTTAAWDYTEELLAELRRRRPGPEVLAAFLDVPADDVTFARNQELVAATLGLQPSIPRARSGSSARRSGAPRPTPAAGS